MDTFTCSIDIRGLPLRYSALVHGGVYAVAGDDRQAMDALLRQTLALCSEHINVWLITSRQFSDLLRSANTSSSVLVSAGRRGAISLLAHNGAAMSPHSFVCALTKDLEHLGVAKGSVVTIDGAECFIGREAGDEEALLGQLRLWAEAKGIICLVLCRTLRVQSHLVRASRQLSGLACVQRAGGQAELAVFHWFTASGVCAAQAFPLELNDAGELVIQDQEEYNLLGGQPAGDRHVVIAARPAVQQTELAPVDWIICDDVPSLLMRARESVASTVVVPFTGAAGFERLAKAVHALRKNCGDRLKIVVREVNMRLRYRQEALVMRLGANMVIPAEVAFARVRGMLSVVQGQVFAHRLPLDFDHAMLDSAPSLEYGYLPPLEFSRAALTVVNVSERLGLQDIMVRLPLGYGLQPFDALRYCAVRREGDLLTADDSNVYLLLHACRESDIAVTLERLFKLPLGEFFTSETSYMSAEQIQNALDDLLARHEVHRYADLTSELANVPVVDGTIPKTATSAHPVRAHEVRYKAPPPAQRRPLKPRGALSLVELEVSE